MKNLAFFFERYLKIKCCTNKGRQTQIYFVLTELKQINYSRYCFPNQVKMLKLYPILSMWEAISLQLLFI